MDKVDMTIQEAIELVKELLEIRHRQCGDIPPYESSKEAKALDTLLSLAESALEDEPRNLYECKGCAVRCQVLIPDVCSFFPDRCLDEEIARKYNEPSIWSKGTGTHQQGLSIDEVMLLVRDNTLQRILENKDNQVLVFKCCGRIGKPIETTGLCPHCNKENTEEELAEKEAEIGRLREALVEIKKCEGFLTPSALGNIATVALKKGE